MIRQPQRFSRGMLSRTKPNVCVNNIRLAPAPKITTITTTSLWSSQKLTTSALVARKRPRLSRPSTYGDIATTTPLSGLARRRMSTRRHPNDSKDDKTDESQDKNFQEDNYTHHPTLGTRRALLLGQLVPFLGDAMGAVAVMGLAALGLLYAKQGSLLYMPEIEGLSRDNRSNPPGYRSPAEYGIPYTTHMIPSTDGVAVHSWLLLQPNSLQVPTVVFCHGNAGNIGIRIPNAVEMYNLQANVLLVEYRGYGESTPATAPPSEQGIQADSEAVLRFITSHAEIDPSQVFVFGRSLGGAVAFHVADYAQRHEIPLAGVMVENTFLSIGKMVEVLLPFLSFLLPLQQYWLKNQWDSSKIMPTLKVPILFLAGDADEIVPHSHMQELFASSTATKKLHVVKNGTHNETWLQGGKAYWDAIRTFLSEEK